jgi:hypothetical protein
MATPECDCSETRKHRAVVFDLDETRKHRAIVFDLDETTGTWGVASMAFKMFNKYAGEAPPTDMFVRHYLERGGARPLLKQLLKMLEEWKRIGRIDEVAIFTAASNINGWVTFLKECMELYAQTPGLFETCIARENSPLAVTESGGVRTVKDLSLVSPDAEHVVLIDDKPEYALNGYVIGVPEYRQDVCIADLMEWMQTVIPDFAYEIRLVFADDAASHPPNNIDFRADNAFYHAAQVLSDIFPEQRALEAGPGLEGAYDADEIDPRSRSSSRSSSPSQSSPRGRKRTRVN